MASSLAPSRELPINFTRPRAGDKESEQLWAFNERARPAQTNGLLIIDSPLPSTGQLRSMLSNLRTALDAREISAALDCLCALVPDYTPSPTVLALRAGAATTSQAHNE